MTSTGSARRTSESPPAGGSTQPTRWLFGTVVKTHRPRKRKVASIDSPSMAVVAPFPATARSAIHAQQSRRPSTGTGFPGSSLAGRKPQTSQVSEKYLRGRLPSGRRKTAKPSSEESSDHPRIYTTPTMLSTTPTMLYTTPTMLYTAPTMLYTLFFLVCLITKTRFSTLL